MYYFQEWHYRFNQQNVEITQKSIEPPDFTWYEEMLYNWSFHSTSIEYHGKKSWQKLVFFLFYIFVT